jgi:putative transposase
VTAVIQAYRFALDPAPGQDVVLRSNCGGQRFAFNWGLALVTYGVPADQLTPSVSWSAYSLRRWWNQAKTTVAPSCAGDGKRARWKPVPDPHRAGSGYRHGKAHEVNAAPQRDGCPNRVDSRLLTLQVTVAR